MNRSLTSIPLPTMCLCVVYKMRFTAFEIELKTSAETMHGEMHRTKRELFLMGRALNAFVHAVHVARRISFSLMRAENPR